MSELFIPSSLVNEKDNSDFRNRIFNVERQLSNVDKTYIRGYVFGIHENTKTKHKEIVDLNHNHVVINGRKFIMQRAVGASLNETPGQHTWFINWFGVGCGGANSSDLFTPLYTPDQQEDLVAPILIHNVDYEGYQYADNGFKKSLKQFDGKNAQMKYDVINSEVLALFHLVIDLNDCPYASPNLGVNINELALYAAPTNNSDETEFTMFSRFCFQTKPKSNADRYTFLWYIYF